MDSPDRKDPPASVDNKARPARTAFPAHPDPLDQLVIWASLDHRDLLAHKEIRVKEESAARLEAEVSPDLTVCLAPQEIQARLVNPVIAAHPAARELQVYLADAETAEHLVSPERTAPVARPDPVDRPDLVERMVVEVLRELLAHEENLEIKV